MKILFYYRVNVKNPRNQGVINKCQSQSKALRNLGHEVDEISLSPAGILRNDQLLHAFSYPFLSRYWTSYFYYFFLLLRHVSQRINFLEYDLLLIRYPMSHPLLNSFLKKARKANPKLRIVLEFPTYPYDREPIGLAHRTSLLLDKFYRKYLKKYVNFILHYGLEKEIYELPTIRIKNGIDVDAIALSSSTPKANTLRLIAMANWSYWHGLDRLIKGLARYYAEKKKEKKVELLVIGEGKALPAYKDLVKTYGLEKVVRFVPPVSKEILDQHFEEADLAVGTLGIFRKGVAIDSSLKHREYCARGIPFILSAPDLSFPIEWPFVHYVEAAEKEVVISEIWKFWEGLGKNKAPVHQAMRTYAKATLAWEEQLKFLNFDT